MKTLLTPKNDFVFKKLFTGDTEILTGLLNCVLDLSGPERIISVEILNPDILPEEIGKKFIILDIRAADSSGTEYDIEMQVRKYDDYSKRSLYYLCRMYGDQLNSGREYSLLHPVIGIHFPDYIQFPGHPGFRYHFRLKDIRYPELTLTDDLSLHILELPGIEKHMGGREDGELREWIHFFNHAHEEGEINMREHYHNPAIHRAFRTLEALSADEITRDLAERREKALKDEAMFLSEARRKGLQEGERIGRKEGKKETLREIAEKLIAKGLDTAEISELTGLSPEEIKKMEHQYH